MPSAPARPVLVVDFGAQYAQLIARRVREARVFSEVIPHTATVEEIKAQDPQAIVLSGGPASVYAEGAPQLDPALFDLGVPVFGICYGFQAMAQALGGTVAHTGTSEYGRTELKVLGGELHSDLPTGPAGVDEPRRRGHRRAGRVRGGGQQRGRAGGGLREPRPRRLAGVQYHPEVMHTPHGQQVLSRFLHEFAGHRRRIGRRPTSPRRWSSRCASRSATARRSAGCPVGWIPRWPPRWCSAPSATG